MYDILKKFPGMSFLNNVDKSMIGLDKIVFIGYTSTGSLTNEVY